MRKLSLILILIGIALTITACSASPSLYINLTSDQTVYHPGEPIAAALTLLNQESAPIQFTLPNTQIYDIYLYDSQNSLVWKWSGDKMFAMALTNFKLEPGLPRTFVFKLNPSKSPGQPLPPGKYQLVGVINAKEKLLSKPLAIEIR